MSTEEDKKVDEEPVTGAPSAETQNTEAQHMIPKSRFDEINKANKDLQARLTTLESEGQTRLEEQLKEQGKYKELAEERAQKLAEMQPKADKLEAAQATLKQVLDAQIESIPDDKRGLVPAKLSTEDQLEWIATNRPLLSKAVAFDIGAGKKGGSGSESVVLTPEQKQAAKDAGVTEADYAKYT